MTDHTVESFHGCYMLVSTSQKYKGWTYIGYTVDPNRRINQHNKGSQFGGAKRTSNRGPWEMVLIIHGFPNDISALRFEWAWQHPKKSRRLYQLQPKKSKESRFHYNIRILSKMLNTGPWNRLPLTIRWLKHDYEVQFDVDSRPPLHMAIVRGPVKSKHINQNSQESNKPEWNEKCFICKCDSSFAGAVKCLHADCKKTFHQTCLARKFLRESKEQDKHLIPVQGCCPSCNENILWGDLIRYKNGCYRDLDQQ